MTIEKEIATLFDVKVKLFLSNNVLTLVNITVPAKYRRQGLGTIVMNHIVREADAQQLDMILHVSPELGTSEHVLIDFYENFGFRIKEYDEEIIMTREKLTF